MKKHSYLSTLLLLAAAALSSAQASKDDKAQVVDALAKAMTERYVLKDKGEAAAQLLRDRLKSGAYDEATTGEAFALALSRDVNSVCSDAHLRVRFSPTPLPARAQAAEPSEAEIAAMAKQMRQANAGFEEVKRLQGNVGYIRFNMFSDPAIARRPVEAAMAFVADTDALIFDLRGNGGGSPSTVRMICSYLFDKPTHVNSLLMRRGDQLVQNDFITEPVKEHAYFDKPIFVVVGKRTGSGAEEFAYNLQTQKRATLIGESTWGGANPGGTVRLGDHYSAFIPVGMAKNPITGKNWEGTGVLPEVEAKPEDALTVAHRMAVEKLKEAAQGSDRERLEQVLKAIAGGS